MTEMVTHVTPRSVLESRCSRSNHTLNPSSASSSPPSSNHSFFSALVTPRRNIGGLAFSSSCPPGLLRTALIVLRPPSLLRLVLATLRVSFPLLCLATCCLVFGATMTSASGDIFTNACVLAGAGVSEVTSILAVEVGVRCNVSGCECPAAGLGSARTCDRKFISRKFACSSMISQSVGVKGSILTV